MTRTTRIAARIEPARSAAQSIACPPPWLPSVAAAISSIAVGCGGWMTMLLPGVSSMVARLGLED
jgi:hypothetical protein